MNTALEQNIISDRLVELVCDDEQRTRYSLKLLPAGEFRDRVRSVLLQGLLDLPVCPHISAKDHQVPEDGFKVLERSGCSQGITAEQFQSFKDVQARCAESLKETPRGIEVTRETALVEKLVISGDKTLKSIPMVLITVTAADPQARCPALVFTRRVLL